MINGVKVRITMSLDVKTVVTEIKRYRNKKSACCDCFTFLIDHEARKEKNPDLSKPIERTDTERKRIRIFKGLIGLLVKRAF